MENDTIKKIRKETLKHPDFLQEDGVLSTRVTELGSRFDIFEAEIVRRTKELLRSHKVV
jgi:hypothetical protein